VNYSTVKLSRRDLVKFMLLFLARHGCWNKGRLTAPADVMLTILLENRNTILLLGIKSYNLALLFSTPERQVNFVRKISFPSIIP